jgi:hypothetical protein
MCCNTMFYVQFVAISTPHPRVWLKEVMKSWRSIFQHRYTANQAEGQRAGPTRRPASAELKKLGQTVNSLL